MNRIVRVSLRYRSIYKIYDIDKNATNALINTKIEESSGLLLSKEDVREIAKYKSDPLSYRMHLELNAKHSRTAENKEVSFFKESTNTKIALLTGNEKRQKQIKNTVAHLSFRSTAYISIIAFYAVVKYLMISKEERKEYLKTEQEWNKSRDASTIIGGFIELFKEISFARFLKNLQELNFGHFYRPEINQREQCENFQNAHTAKSD